MKRKTTQKLLKIPISNVCALKNFAKFTGKHLCLSLVFNKVAVKFIKKETPTQLHSCEFCKILRTPIF